MSFHESYTMMSKEMPKEYFIRYGFTSRPRSPEETPHHDDPLIQQRLRFAPDMIAQTTIDNDLLAIVDKSNPHTLTDAMISAFGHERPIISFDDASDKMRTMILEWMHGFANFVSSQETREEFGLDNAFMRIGVNIDHNTNDRGGIQGVRMLHPHCLCFPSIEEYPTRQTLQFPADKEHLLLSVDPIARVGAQALKDYFNSGQFPDSIYNVFDSTTRESDPNTMPLAFNLRLKDSWDSLTDPTMSHAVADLDKTMLSLYNSIRFAMTGLELSTTLGPWQRPPLLDADTAYKNIDALPYLSTDTKEELKLVFSNLRPVSPRVMEHLKESRRAGGVSAAEKILSLGGLAYGMTFYSPGTINVMRSKDDWLQPAYLSVQPALRKATGVAGFTIDNQGRHFKVERGGEAQLIDERLRAYRDKFQQSFAESLGIRSGAAENSPAFTSR